LSVTSFEKTPLWQALSQVNYEKLGLEADNQLNLFD